VRGQIEITVVNETFDVARDNEISFQAKNVHRYQNKGDETAEAFMIISYLP
jgi:hypothetical protein